MTHRSMLVGCVSCLALTFASSALAQDGKPAGKAATGASPGGGLEDIVVTAQKRSENLQKVPISITAVSPLALANAGIQSTQNLPAVLPGLQVLNIAGSLTPRVRGVGSGFTAAGLESPVATFVDDVYHAFAADIDLDFADVAQVALLKGPQGTLFGRNSTGGVLQVTTRQPSLDFKGSFETSLDNYLTTRSNLFLTGGLSEKVAASLSVSYAHQDKGYGTNFATGHDNYKIDHALGVRGKIRAFLDDRTTLDLQGDYTSREGPYAVVLRVVPGYSTRFPTPQPKRVWDNNVAHDSDVDFSGGGASLKIAHKFDFATLTSISAYRKAKNYYDFTNIPTNVLLTDIPVTFRSSQYTQEVQLVSPSTGLFTWTVGGFYFYNDADVDFSIINFGPQIAPFKKLYFPGHQKTNSVAAFAQATYKITDSTRITAGIRYTKDRKHFVGKSIFTFPAGNTLLIASRDATYSKSAPTWRFALDHDLSPHVLVFASYNRGLKSGGFNTTSTNNPPFDPERLDAYEVGVKSEFLDNRVRLNVAGFYYNYKNIQVPEFTGGVVNVLNAASARNYGIDADLAAQITDRLALSASANLLHARFKEFPNAPFAIPKPNFQGATQVVGNAAGNTLPYSPTFTYTIGANYDLPTSVGDITLNLTDSYNSGFFSEIDNVLRQKSYHFLNASVGWKSPGNHYSARVFVNNILNEAVFSQAVTTTSSYHADYTNPPLVFGVSGKINF